MNFIYIFELRDEELDVVKIITVKYATYAVPKRKTEKTFQFQAFFSQLHKLHI